MNAAHGTPRVNFWGRPLLLADRRTDIDPPGGVDVVVVDLDDVSPAELQSLVVEAGADGPFVGARAGGAPGVDAALRCGVSLVVLDVDCPDAAIGSIVDAGALVVVPVDHPSTVSTRAAALASTGVDLTRVAFEIDATQAVAPVGLHHLAANPLALIGPATDGIRLGVCLAPGDGSLTHQGWEIGVLAACFSAGVATVRGVDPRRFHRVRSVLDALNGLEPAS